VADCDDHNPAINPNAAEVIGNATDENCNGTTGILRRLAWDLSSSTGWTNSTYPSPQWNGDAVRVSSGGWTYRTGGWMQMVGGTRVVVDVDQASGADCTVSLDNNALPAGPTWTATVTVPSGTGTHTLDFSTSPDLVSAPRRITKVKLACPVSFTTNAMTVDWLTVQDGEGSFPPAEDVEPTWEDVMARTDSSASLLAAASDVAGVGWYDGSGWTAANGSGADRLLRDEQLAVWDLVFLDTGVEMLALTGAYDPSGHLYGGVMESVDGGYTWFEGEDGYEGDDDGVVLAGHRRTHVCGNPDSDGRIYSGGRLLVTDGSNAFVAGAVADEQGVYLRDTSGVYCGFPSNLASLGTPTYVGAMAIQSLPTADPLETDDVLLVGYLGEDPDVDAIYACVLPEGLSCDAASPTATCAGVIDSEGVDVRDIEVDPVVPEMFYVADGGWTPTDPGNDSTCPGSSGRDSTIEKFTFDLGMWHHVKTLADSSMASLSTALSGGVLPTITGLAIGPDPAYTGADPWLFAILFRGSGSGYGALHGLFRIPWTDIAANSPGASDTWEDMVTSTYGDRVERDLHTTGEWLEGAGMSQAVPPPHPADSTAAASVDGTWWRDSTGTDYLLLTGANNIWRVEGMELPTGMDPESDTWWVYWPDTDLSTGLSWQQSVASDVAVDHAGTAWMTYNDLGLYSVAPEDDVANDNAGFDCINQTIGGEGRAVSVASDGTVWAALTDDSYGSTSTDYPAEMSILRSTDHGVTWCYQGAARTGALENFRTEQGKYHVCRYDTTATGVSGLDTGTVRHAPSCDLAVVPPTADWDWGAALSNNENANPTQSWGAPFDVLAVSDLVAVAAFKSYSVGGEVPGRLAYTVDGGSTWTQVTFDGDADPGDAGVECTAYDFYSLGGDLVGVKPGSLTYDNGDTDGDGSSDDWARDVLISGETSLYSSKYYSDGTDYRCGLARVQLSASSPTPTWTWGDLTQVSSGCRLNRRVLAGLDVSPTRNLIYLWGDYTYERADGESAKTEFGGICSLPLDFTVSTTPTLVLAPSNGTSPQHRYSIGGVAPHPSVSDALLVLPHLSAGQCYQDDGCDEPFPLLLEQRNDGSGWAWVATEVDEDGLASLHAVGAYWTPYGTLGDWDWYVPTAGSGVQRAGVSW
jgi:hypothetical protein